MTSVPSSATSDESLHCAKHGIRLFVLKTGDHPFAPQDLYCIACVKEERDELARKLSSAVTRVPDEKPWAYALTQPAGREFDYLIFPDRADAEASESNEEEGVCEIIPLYPRPTIASSTAPFTKWDFLADKLMALILVPRRFSDDEEESIQQAVQYLRECGGVHAHAKAPPSSSTATALQDFHDTISPPAEARELERLQLELREIEKLLDEAGVPRVTELQLTSDRVRGLVSSAKRESWKRVSNASLARQVAWIDRDARHVAVVKDGREYILTLPELPDHRSDSNGVRK